MSRVSWQRRLALEEVMRRRSEWKAFEEAGLIRQVGALSCDFLSRSGLNKIREFILINAPPCFRNGH